MKLFVAFIAIVAVAAAVPFKPAAGLNEELEAIVAAIQSPNTDPATAVLLEQQLQEIISGVLPPIAAPIIVPTPIVPPSPIVPPYPIVPAPIVPSPIVPAPVVPSPASSPLVQIIVNVKSADDVSPIVPTPIQIVDEAFDNNPIVPEPIQIVDSPPVPVQPILIAEPINPIPAVNLPGQLN